jgi:hypothetical protein
MFDNPKTLKIIGLILGLAFLILSAIAKTYYAGAEAPHWLAAAQWVIGQIGIGLGLNVGLGAGPKVPK